MRYNSRRRSNFASVSAILSGLRFSSTGPGIDVWKPIRQVANNWEHIVGGKIAPSTSPHSLRGTTLYVNTINSVWATELGFMSENIKAKINAFLKRKRIKNIHFSVGEVVIPLNQFADRTEIESVVLDASEEARVLNSLSPLKGELRDILARVITKSFKRRKFRDALDH